MAAYTFDRRRLLAVSGSLGLMAGIGGLAGCSSSTKGDTSAGGTESVELPTYKEYEAVKPDLPSSEAGVQPGFYKYPKEHPKSVQEKPGGGGSLSTMNPIYYAPPPKPPNNRFWIELNKRLGVDLQMQTTTASNYDTKLATTIAGGDLPDLVRFQTAQPSMPQLMAAKFVNLADHLSGDKVLKYPNLANIPTDAWKAGLYGDGFYGFPVSRPLVGNGVFIRKDLLDAAGAATQPESYAEFLEGAKALTDPKKRRWGLGRSSSLITILSIMSGVPNFWRRNGDKLVRSFETEEYKQTISRAQEAWKAGIVHPDGFDPNAPWKNWFAAGTIAIDFDGILAWEQYAQSGAKTRGFELSLMRIPKYDGGGLAPWWLGFGFFGFQAISKEAESRVDEILRICNYLAAPFGTDENFFITFGIEGVDYNMKNGIPTLTERGQTETAMRLDYVAQAPSPLYLAGAPKSSIDIQHKFQVDEVPIGIKNPVVGLYSPTDASKGATIDTAFSDSVNDIIQNRRKLNELDSLLESWRKGGGDKIREEYQKQLGSE